MDFDTSEDHDPDLATEARQSRRRMFRAVFYFACSTVILAAILVALVSASAPPSGDARIVVIDSAGTRLPSDDTIEALRQACARERIEDPSWHWTLFRPTEIALSCVVRNRDTNLAGTLLWHFSDFGNDQAGHSLVLLTGIDLNGQAQDAYTAGYFLIAVLHAR